MVITMSPRRQRTVEPRHEAAQLYGQLIVSQLVSGHVPFAQTRFGVARRSGVTVHVGSGGGVIIIRPLVRVRLRKAPEECRALLKRCLPPLYQLIQPVLGESAYRSMVQIDESRSIPALVVGVPKAEGLKRLLQHG